MSLWSTLQRVNQRRLESNLMYSYRQLIADPVKAREATNMTAAMIDGMWLRSILSAPDERDFREAERLCKEFIYLQAERAGMEWEGSKQA